MPSTGRPDRIAADLTERVLEKLGIAAPPPVDLAGLGEVYAAWCRRVPFDNVRKRIWLHEEIPGPLPGDDATDFFESWLEHGTGGTCWAGNGALHALLDSLGFAARLGVGTMMIGPDSPPDHGTVAVRVDGGGNGEGAGDDYLVDASFLFDEPLRLSVGTAIEAPAWRAHAHEVEGQLRINWRPFFAESCDCRIESLDATRETFKERHEATRVWGPFNFTLSARLIEGESMIGASFGPRAEIDPEGVLALTPLSGEERVAFLVDRIGISEEMARRLPPDEEVPPRPGS